jgi:DNA-binding IclR family transcriptional regulator
MLAYDPKAAEQAMSEPLTRFTGHTITDADALSAELDHIRRLGVAFDDEESRAGLNCVAAPVLDRTGRAVAALSIAGRRGHIDTRRLSTDARRIAAAASRAWTGRAGQRRAAGLPRP